MARSETAVRRWEKGIAKSREKGRQGENKWRENGAWQSCVSAMNPRVEEITRADSVSTSFDGSTGNRVEGEVCSEKRKLAHIIRFVRPNLPICFPFTASLFIFPLCAFPFFPPPPSFFILSYIFFALPFAATGHRENVKGLEIGSANRRTTRRK